MRTEEEFSGWYNAAIERGTLTDKRYPIKGMNVLFPCFASEVELAYEGIARRVTP